MEAAGFQGLTRWVVQRGHVGADDISGGEGPLQARPERMRAAILVANTMPRASYSKSPQPLGGL